MISDIQFDAFISYKHSAMDKIIAEAIQKFLEEYKIPHRLIRSGVKRKINRIFRDREELSSSGSLSDDIASGLKNSEFLLLICSRDTPLSVWVGEEVKTFIALGRGDKIIPILIDGSLEEAFPAVLLEYGKMHPQALNYIDLRANGLIESLEMLKLKKDSLACRLLQCDYSALVKEKQYERILIRGLVFAVFAVAFLIFGAFSFSQWRTIVSAEKEIRSYKRQEEFDTKKINLAKADVIRVINQLTYDVPNKISGLGDNRSGIIKMAETNIKLLDSIAAIEPDSVEAKKNQGYSYILTGENYVLLGNVGLSQDNFQKSIDLLEKLHKRDKKDTSVTLYLAMAYRKLGYCKMFQSELDSSESILRKSLELYKLLSKKNDAPDSKLNLSMAYEDLGYVLIKQGKLKEASDDFQKSFSTTSKYASDSDAPYISARKYMNTALSKILLDKGSEALDIYQQNIKTDDSRTQFVIGSAFSDAILLRNYGYRDKASMVFDCLKTLNVNESDSKYINTAKAFSSDFEFGEGQTGGVYIFGFDNNSGMKINNLEIGDVIVCIDGKYVGTPSELIGVLGSISKDDPERQVQVDYLRLMPDGTFVQHRSNIKLSGGKLGIICRGI